MKSNSFTGRVNINKASSPETKQQLETEPKTIVQQSTMYQPSTVRLSTCTAQSPTVCPCNVQSSTVCSPTVCLLTACSPTVQPSTACTSTALNSTVQSSTVCPSTINRSTVRHPSRHSLNVVRAKFGHNKLFKLFTSVAVTDDSTTTAKTLIDSGATLDFVLRAFLT